MTAEELVPEEPTFFLKSKNKEYHLSIPKFHETIWLSKQGDLKNLLDQSKWPELCRLIYKLLVEKNEFLATKEQIIDDEGFPKEVILSGPDKLYHALETSEEAGRMLGALFAALAASNPIAKQQLQDLKKKDLPLSQIGEKSLTSLPQSTDTPLRSLENSA